MTNANIEILLYTGTPHFRHTDGNLDREAIAGFLSEIHFLHGHNTVHELRHPDGTSVGQISINESPEEVAEELLEWQDNHWSTAGWVPIRPGDGLS